MPRRNRRYRKVPYAPPLPVDDGPNYELIARDLVLAGVCSPLILERPVPQTEGNRTT